MIMAAGCAGTGEQPGSSAGDAASVGGDGPPLYRRPVQLVPGNYVSPAESPEAQARGAAAAEAAAGKAQFDGTVNGIRLYSFAKAAADPSVARDPCRGEITFRESSSLVFRHLPPGTMAKGPQYEAVCDDGSKVSLGQQFATLSTDFDVWIVFGEPAFGHDASADRVKPTSIGGRAGVTIEPLTPEGFGRSWAAVPLGSGLLVVDARNLPLEEVLKIAEGVACTVC